MNISIVVPLLNEAESLPELEAWIRRVMDQGSYTYEIIFVDDGSTDNSWQVIQELSEASPHVRGISFQRNYGKSAALNTAFAKTRGDVVITMDADLQDSPDEIPELYRMIMEDGYDLVSGWKQKRHDPILSKNLPSKFYNWTARRMTGIMLHDFNCGLKAYRNAVVKSIEVYGDMHRYIPVLAKWGGFKKIGEKVVHHQERKYGSSKFGMERFVRGPLDLMSVIFISKFRKRPMHFFGGWGFFFLMAGFAILLFLSIGHFFFEQGNMDERPLFYFGILFLIVGTQLFMTGFLAELVSRSSNDRNRYLIQEEIPAKQE